MEIQDPRVDPNVDGGATKFFDGMGHGKENYMKGVIGTPEGARRAFYISV